MSDDDRRSLAGLVANLDALTALHGKQNSYLAEVAHQVAILITKTADQAVRIADLEVRCERLEASRTGALAPH